MQCFEKRESENIKERRKMYAARDFSDKCLAVVDFTVRQTKKH
jgi:hypothetical protein